MIKCFMLIFDLTTGDCRSRTLTRAAISTDFYPVTCKGTGFHYTRATRWRSRPRMAGGSVEGVVENSTVVM